MLDIDTTLSQAANFLDKSQYHEAMALLNELVVQHPASALAWSKRGHANARAGHLDAALKDIASAINLSPNEPAYRFTRGMWLVDNLHFAEAVVELNACIDLEAKWNDAYYAETAYFFRAIAHVYLGEYDEALSDCEHLSDDFSFWAINRIYTKAELVDHATRRCMPPLKKRKPPKVLEE